MRNTILFVLIGLAAGFILLTLLPGRSPDAPRANPARESAALPAPDAQPAIEPPQKTTSVVREALVVQVPHLLVEDELGDEVSEPAATEDRVGGLVAAGFTAARAAEILQREAELRRVTYTSELGVSATIQPLSSAARSDSTARLRAELGDADYERYLEGTGQPRSVVVQGVDTNSAAEQAGIMPGDEILSYAGRRVFNQRDLNGLMLTGSPGEVVATTVMRNGQLLDLYVTRGPLGLL